MVDTSHPFAVMYKSTVEAQWTSVRPSGPMHTSTSTNEKHIGHNKKETQRCAKWKHR